LLDAGDDAKQAAALPAGVDVDGEHALEALRPGEARRAVDGRWTSSDDGLVPNSSRPYRSASFVRQAPISGSRARSSNRASQPVPSSRR
jgi:hypothetical protein